MPVDAGHIDNVNVAIADIGVANVSEDLLKIQITRVETKRWKQKNTDP